MNCFSFGWWRPHSSVQFSSVVGLFSSNTYFLLFVLLLVPPPYSIIIIIITFLFFSSFFLCYLSSFFGFSSPSFLFFSSSCLLILLLVLQYLLSPLATRAADPGLCRDLDKQQPTNKHFRLRPLIMISFYTHVRYVKCSHSDGGRKKLRDKPALLSEDEEAFAVWNWASGIDYIHRSARARHRCLGLVFSIFPVHRR